MMDTAIRIVVSFGIYLLFRSFQDSFSVGWVGGIICVLIFLHLGWLVPL